MNKSDLIDALALDQNLPIQTAVATVATGLDAMTETLVNGGNVEIRGFGSFTIRKYRPYDGRNPKTGQKLEVKPKNYLSSRWARNFVKLLIAKSLEKGVNDGTFRCRFIQRCVGKN